MALSFSLGNGLIGNNTFQAKRRKFGVGSLIVLLLIGVVFIGAGLAFYKSTRINPGWKQENGTVSGAAANNSGSGTTYSPIVRYTVNGQTYQVTGNSGNSSYPQNGTTKQVAYNPQAPADAKLVTSGSEKLFILLFAGIGVVLVVAGPIAFVRSLHRSVDIKDLTQTGQKIRGILVDIQQNNGGVQGGNTVRSTTNISYRLVVSATGPTGAVESYLSDWMSGIGGLAMADYRNNPIPIDIYVNPANPKDYYVDVTEVPTLTPERITQLIQSAAHLGQPVSMAPGATPPIVPSATPAAPPATPAPGATTPNETPPSPPAPQT